MIQVKNNNDQFSLTIKKRRPTNCELCVLLNYKWWNLLTNFIHLGGPLLWSKDGKLYIIGVHVRNRGDCKNYKDYQNYYSESEPIHKNLGWILKHVNGEVCGTEDKINDWFDQAREDEDIKYWE